MPASILAALVILIALADAAAARAQPVYEVEVDRANRARQDGTLTVPFNVRRVADGRPVLDLKAAEIVVSDHGRPLRDVQVRLPPAVPVRHDPVAVVLVVDSAATVVSTEAPRRLIGGMPPGASLLVLPSSGRLGDRQFVTDRMAAERDLDRLPQAADRAVIDAAHAAVAALEAVARPGRKAVGVITDGVDLHSRHRVEEVIADAQAARIAVHVVSTAEDAGEVPLRRLAEATGGTFMQARDPAKLTQACEELLLRLHGDGVEGVAQPALAEAALRSTYSATFPSRGRDDSAEGIDIYVQRDGVPLSRTPRSAAPRPGRLTPELQPTRYLALLALLCGLLALPGRRRVAAS